MNWVRDEEEKGLHTNFLRNHFGQPKMGAKKWNHFTNKLAANRANAINIFIYIAHRNSNR